MATSTETQSEPSIEFNPNPVVQRVPVGEAQACYVIDDALVDAHRLVRFAAQHAHDFGPVNYNAYPGILLPTPGAISARLNTFFIDHLRRVFDARRVLSMHSRLALVTLPPQELRPYQRVCHSDSMRPDPRRSLQASVLYLFDDASLGGTSFYQSKLPPYETLQLFNDASSLSNGQFAQRYDIQPGYLCESNRYFHRIGHVAAKFNRLIFYDGAILHSGDILAPEKLSADPRIGRLTLNGFFTSRRHAA
jgi:hypothetical protein